VIVGSVLLVTVAAVLLVLGLVTLSDTLLYSSIVGSVLAALALIVGVRQLPAARLPEVDFDVRPGGPGPVSRSPRPIGRALPPPQSRIPADANPEGMASADLDALSGADPTVPADEPAEEAVTERDTAAVSRLAAEVVVVDGRPRYHIEACVHLLGLETERLPILEALELGFSPCALCTPVTSLLAQDRDHPMSADT
jgi:hypothetical protein